MLQSMTLQLKGKVRVTGAYLSPMISGTATSTLLQEVVQDSSGQDMLFVDLNARHYTWDATSNPKGRALWKGTKGHIYQLRAPGKATYRPRGHIGASTPDLVVANFREVDLETPTSGCWTAASDHAPVIGRIGIEGDRERMRRGKRISKDALQNAGRVKEVGRKYRRIQDEIIERLRGANMTDVQGIYESVSAVLVNPWKKHASTGSGVRRRTGRKLWREYNGAGGRRIGHG